MCTIVHTPAIVVISSIISMSVSSLIVNLPVEFSEHIGHRLDLHLHASRSELAHKR